MSNRAYLYATSFSTGFAVMAGELGVARMLAPHFGTSTPVWAFVIGTVMASLSLGYLVGGRLAECKDPVVLLPKLVAASAIALLVLPAIGTSLLSGSLSLFLQGAVGHLLALAALAMPLFAVPFFLLGTISPVLLTAMFGRDSGAASISRSSGWLYASGTWGGLLGTFVPGLLLVPLLGSRLTLMLCGLALLAVALVGMRAHRRAALVTLACAALALIVGAQWRPQPRPHTLVERESSYHLLRVVDNGGRRRLSFDEGYATQSLQMADGSLPLFDVWGYYATAPAWTQTGVPKEVLILGLGGGTSAKLYAELYLSARVTGVEIDPAVVDIGREYFGLPSSTRVVTEDARTFVNHDNGLYDVIIVDAFHFPYVPFQLTTVEFFDALSKRLSPGGAVMLNVGRDGNERDVVDAVAATLRAVFPHVLGVDVPNPSNTMLVAMHHIPQASVGLARLPLPQQARVALERLPKPGPWPLPPGAPILTDDKAPVEWLTDRIVLRRFLRLLLHDAGDTSDPA